MKKVCLRVLVTASILLTSCSVMNSLNLDTPNAGRLSNPRTAGLEPVSFVPPEPAEWTTPNGMTVLFLPDQELPFVRISLYTRGGGLWELPQEQGVASATGAMMRRGGTARLTPDELDLTLERLSASVSTSIGGEYGTFGFSCLKSDLDEVGGLFAEVLLTPRFDEEKLALFKAQLLESIRRRSDDGDTIASIAFSQIAYGDSPFGTVLESSDVAELTREKLLAWHASSISPAGSLLVVTGDLSREEVENFYQRHLARWQGSSNDRKPPEIGESRPPAIYFIEAPFSQATVVAGQLGVPRFSEDHFAIKVFNKIFGLGLGTSRLYQRVRSELGLAYSVYGYIAPGLQRGLNTINMQTKGESAGLALRESMKVIAQMQQQGVATDELRERRRGVLNSFVFANEDAEATVFRQAVLRLFGYPLNYDSIYMDRVAAISEEQIKDVAKRRWPLHKMFAVVVGPPSARASLEEQKASFPAPMDKLEILDASFDEKLRL